MLKHKEGNQKVYKSLLPCPNLEYIWEMFCELVGNFDYFDKAHYLSHSNEAVYFAYARKPSHSIDAAIAEYHIKRDHADEVNEEPRREVSNSNLLSKMW